MLNQSENYKSTLNLPKTSMPMHCNLPSLETELLTRWEEMKLYQKIISSLESRNQPLKYFTLHDGPPYANGMIHVGHALNKCLKDFILKSKRLFGYVAQYVPGWDCHGLPIELKAEQIATERKKEISPSEFRAICRKYAQTQIDLQKKAFIRLGILGNWKEPYLTMDFKTQANTIRALGELYKHKHLKRGTLPIYWCLSCQSAISDSEVEYKSKIETAVYVRFLALDQSSLESIFSHSCTKGRISAIIWTTTPWTLPANEAIAIHPELIYQLIQVERGGENDYLLLAKACVPSTLAVAKIKDYCVIGECVGSELLNLKFCHPFLAKSISMIGSAHVTDSSGTGLVHIAPAHGPEDFDLGMQYHLPIQNVVDFQGHFPADHPILPGVSFEDSWQNILEILQEAKSLYAQLSHEHRVACCWRHGSQLIYLTTPQWFISMEQSDLRTQSMAALKAVQWHAPWGKERMEQLIGSRPDWCISRQRLWGNPLPLFIHKETKELHPNSYELMQVIAAKIEEKGSEIWWELPIESLLEKEADQYEKETSVLDVWLDSGLTHASLNRGEEIQFPANLYCEGNDQYRGWFMSSLLTSVGLTQSPPYQEVLSHGFTVDERGQKMSKSLENIIDPMEISKSKGADILRLWAANCEYRKEVAISEAIIEQSQEHHRRIRNTLRFILGNLSDFNVETDAVSSEELVAIDQWILMQAAHLNELMQKNYEQYQFQWICKAIVKFCSIDLGSLYFTTIKDRLYVMDAQSKSRRSAQTALYHLVQLIVRWIAPILSFTAEEVWQYTPGDKEESVFLTQWWNSPTILPAHQKLSVSEWEAIFELRLRVFLELDRFRQMHKIRSNLDLSVTLHCCQAFLNRWLAFEEELALFFSVSQVELKANKADISENPNDWLEGISAWVIEVRPVNDMRCNRCWMKIIPLEKQAYAICHRCEEVLSHGSNAKDRWFV